MEELTRRSTNKGTDVKKGDSFTFVTYIDGEPTQLTGCVEIMMSSSKARKLGLTKSKRRRLYLGLKVEGRDELFWKDKGQVKLTHKSLVVIKDHQERGYNGFEIKEE